MSKGYQPTEAQLALAQERRLKRELQRKSASSTPTPQEEARGRILPREWFRLQDVAKSSDGHNVKLMTWNLLAQCLVRRELFPTSDCLKASQREYMLYQEILSHQADICCLQEIDRTEKLFPVLEQAGYAYVYASGPRKKHGCLIAYRKDAYELVDERKVSYDEQIVRQEGTERARHGSSFFTKNIASLVALRRSASKDDGVIVATTHLFWHPSYTYERTRQTGILLREVAQFRQDLGQSSWPCIIAGDFNFAPDDPAYSLLVGDNLLPAQSERLASSRVVHVTIDPDVPITSKAPAEEEEGAESAETDPDRIITNARPAEPTDGLLTDIELGELFKRSGAAISAYDQGQRTYTDPGDIALTFGSRVTVPPGRLGAFEPVWTSYTHYWKTVLDYIFILDPPSRRVTVTSLSKPHPTDSLIPGLPRKDVCGSDHISLSAELSWPRLQ